MNTNKKGLIRSSTRGRISLPALRAQTEDQGLGFGGSASHPSCFTLDCEPAHRTSCAESSDPILSSLAPPRNPVHTDNEQEVTGQAWQSPTLTRNKSDLLPAMRTEQGLQDPTVPNYRMGKTSMHPQHPV